MRQTVAFLAALLLFAIASTGMAVAQAITLDPSCRELKGENATVIRELINEVDSIQGKGEFYDITAVYPVLAQLNKRVSSDNDIEAFRCQDSLDTIRKLIAFARIDERTIRVNASLLLANVVDNTTLCGVLEELYDPALNDNTRYNLWQVVLVVAGYARKENKVWIGETIGDNKRLAAERGNLERTLQKIADVEAALRRNDRTESLLDSYVPQFKACTALPHISAIKLP